VTTDDVENHFDSPLHHNTAGIFQNHLVTPLSWPWLFGAQSEPKQPYNAI
jgi:hypothetical protein